MNTWVKQADLWRVEGMTTDMAYLLVQIGVRNAEDLMKIDAEIAYHIMERLVLAQPDFILQDFTKLKDLIENASETFGLSQNNISLNIETTEESPNYLFRSEFKEMNSLTIGKIIKDGLEFLDNLPRVLPLPSSVTGKLYKKSKYETLDKGKDFANHLLVEVGGIASSATDKSDKDKIPSAYTDSEGNFKIIFPEKFNMQEGITISVSDDMCRCKQKFMLNAEDIISAVPEQKIIDKFDELQRLKMYVEEKQADKNYYDALEGHLKNILEDVDSILKELETLESEDGSDEKIKEKIKEKTEEKAEYEKYRVQIESEIARLKYNYKDIEDAQLYDAIGNKINDETKGKTKYQQDIDRLTKDYNDIRDEILASDSTTNDLEKIFLNLLNKKLSADIGEFTAIKEILEGADTDVKKAMPSVKLMGNDDEAIHLSSDTAPSRVFNYNMLQRLVEPDITGEEIQFNNNYNATLPLTAVQLAQLLKTVKVDKRKKLNSPVDVMNFKKQMYANPDKYPQMSSLGIGYILEMHQAWVPDGFALGNLLYSLILAPGEEQRLIVRENIQRYEISDEAEGIDTDNQTYTGSQTDDATAAYNYGMQEAMRGSSNYSYDANTSATGGGIGSGIGGAISGVLFGLGGGASSSRSSSWGHGASSSSQSNARNEASSAAQHVQHSIKSASNRISQSKRISVTTATSEETESVATKIIANHNHSHAMTIQYWEVMRRYRLETCIDGVDLVLFVPLKVIKFIPDGKYTLDNTSNFNRDAFNNRYDILLKYSDSLLPALPYKYRTGLNLIKKYAAYPNWEMEKTDVGERSLTLEFNCDLLSFDDLTATLTLKNNRGNIAGAVHYIRSELDSTYKTRKELDQAIRDIRNGKINKRVHVTCGFSVPAGITDADLSHITLDYSCEGLQYTLYQDSFNPFELIGELIKIGQHNSHLPEAYRDPNVTYSASKIKSLGAPTISELRLQEGGLSLWSTENVSAFLTGHPMNLGESLPVMASSNKLVSSGTVGSLFGGFLGGRSSMGSSTSVKITIGSGTPVLRYTELQTIEETMHHIASETVRYSQVVWASLSHDERAMMLEQYTIDMNFDELPGNEEEGGDSEERTHEKKIMFERISMMKSTLTNKGVRNASTNDEITIPLLNCVDVKKMVGFYGNCMLLPFTFPQKLADKLKKTAADIQDSLYRYHTRNFRVPTTTISLPTDGMVGEAVLSETNVSEVIDLTRFWNWKDSPIDKMELSSDYLNPTDYLADKATKDVSALNVQGATPATPVTVNDLITALASKQTPAFENITGLGELKEVLNAGTTSAATGRDKIMDNAKEYAQIAKDIIASVSQQKATDAGKADTKPKAEDTDTKPKTEDKDKDAK